MRTDVDDQIARSSEFLERTRERYTSVSKRSRRQRETEIVGRLGRIAAVDGLILLGAIIAGMMSPVGIGVMGAFIVMLLLAVATFTLAVFPRGHAPTLEALSEAPLKALPLTTERWLDSQRLALPAPVRSLVDSIGVKLETLAPQLATLDEKEPAANEIRKLLGEQLPELVKGYQRVPEPLRNIERHGLTPDQQLTQGLQLIDDEIAEMTEQLAQGDLDSLATRNRYLQIRYRDED